VVERYTQINGGKDIKSRTIDKSRLDATSETLGYILKVQSDGSLDFEPVIANLNDIGDVEVPSPVEGDRLRYDSGSGTYKNSKMKYDSDFRAYLLE